MEMSVRVLILVEQTGHALIGKTSFDFCSSRTLSKYHNIGLVGQVLSPNDEDDVSSL